MTALAIPALTMSSVEIASLTGEINLGRVVYLIGDDSRTKIGVTKNPKQRLPSVVRTAGITNPKLMISPPLMNAHKIESSFKRDFHSLRLSGEWFRISLADATRDIECRGWDFVTEHDVQAEHNARQVSADLQDEMFNRIFPLSHGR